MTDEGSVDPQLMRARTVGARTAAGVAVLTGLGLALLAHGNVGLIASVALATVAVAAFSRRAGSVAGEKIAGRGWLSALGIGVLGGLAALLVAALCAAAAGLVWFLHDGARDQFWIRDYLGKPFLGVLGYGCIVALVLGAVTGAIIRALTGRSK